MALCSRSSKVVIELTFRLVGFYNRLKVFGRKHLDPLEYARKIVDVASDKQAANIVLLDIRKLGVFADAFVIMTADSRRQMTALVEDLLEAVAHVGARARHREGTVESGWVLLDFGDVVVHLFAPDERSYYQLEELWSQGQQIVRIQ